MTTYVCGHKNPDTDSVVSAIVYAEIEGVSPRVSGEINKETEYVLKRFGYQVPDKIESGDFKIILVDHNSPEEMAEGILAEQVIGIVDHHKLSGPFTPEPIEVFMKPYGATATIVALLAEGHQKKLTKNQASLLLSGIISDTFLFTSPTMTEKDKEVAENLNKIAGLDLEELAAEMFRVKSDISDIKTEDLITKDMKTFNFSGKKVAIGVWETVDPQSILERRAEILSSLKKEKDSQGFDFIYFVAVDIVGQKSHFFLLSEAEKKVAEVAFECESVNNVLISEGTVSRKKQIAPAFEGYFSK